MIKLTKGDLADTQFHFPSHDDGKLQYCTEIVRKIGPGSDGRGASRNTKIEFIFPDKICGKYKHRSQIPAVVQYMYVCMYVTGHQHPLATGRSTHAEQWAGWKRRFEEAAKAGEPTKRIWEARPAGCSTCPWTGAKTHFNRHKNGEQKRSAKQPHAVY